jgi:hypothetical protein
LSGAADFRLPDGAKPELAKTLGSAKKEIRIVERKNKIAEGSQERKAWRRMVIELVLASRHEIKKHAIRARL